MIDYGLGTDAKGKFQMAGAPLEAICRHFGLMVDQKILAALSTIPQCNAAKVECYFLRAIWDTNSVLTRHLPELKRSFVRAAEDNESRSGGQLFKDQIEQFNLKRIMQWSDSYISPFILKTAQGLAGKANVITPQDYLRTYLKEARERDHYSHRIAPDGSWRLTPEPMPVISFVELKWLFTDDHTLPIEKIPRLNQALIGLENDLLGDRDFNYILTLENDGRVKFNVSTFLGEYQQSSEGLITTVSANLIKFKKKFTFFTEDEVAYLEDLINHPATRERDLQKFFKDHEQFLHRWNYRTVYPQIYLHRNNDGPLIPDFILTDSASQRSIILELKLPTHRIVTRRKNRTRFSSILLDAKAQLLEYMEWFRLPENRQKIALPNPIYEPKLAVVIGRSSEFDTTMERLELEAREPGIEIVTYDDIVRFASQRLVDLT